jgi:peptide/nickel transport system ATP-binding protein
MSALLEADNVTKSFGGGFINKTNKIALENFSLQIEDGRPSVTVIAGESGSGKTTLARLLLGIIDPTEGQIRYRGKDLATMSADERKIFRREVQAIFQDPFEVYNPFHKVDRVLTMPLRRFGLTKSESETKKLIADALDAVGLHPEDTLGRFPHQLSGGQRQRIMVARALVLHPRVIIADEPVSMVDASLRATILESLLKLNRELGISLIYITHDLTTAYQVGDSIFVLYQGAVTELGDIGLVIKQPLHPYTQLLVESIPRPDPAHKWGQNSIILDEDSSMIVSDHGCRFASRCPHVMDICREKAVPIFRTDAARGAACFLYADKPAIQQTETLQMVSQIVQSNLPINAKGR